MFTVTYLGFCVCRLIAAYDIHQKLQQEMQAVKKHRISSEDASQYVCWLFCLRNLSHFLCSA